MFLLNDHRADRPTLGVLEFKDDRLRVRFLVPVTRDQFFSIFGNVGFTVTEPDGENIRAAEILEFSLSP